MFRPLVQQGKQLAQFLDDGRMRVKERDKFGSDAGAILDGMAAKWKARHEATIRVRQVIQRCRLREALIGSEPQRVVHVENACQAIADQRLVWPWRGHL